MARPAARQTGFPVNDPEWRIFTPEAPCAMRGETVFSMISLLPPNAPMGRPPPIIFP